MPLPQNATQQQTALVAFVLLTIASFLITIMPLSLPIFVYVIVYGVWVGTWFMKPLSQERPNA